MVDPRHGDSMFWIPREGKSADEEAALRRHPKVFGLPYPAMLRAAVTDVMDRYLGFTKSAEARKGVAADGRPIPLMSYSFVEYVMGLDLSGFRMLEIGGGNSTLFWSDRAKSVLTLEHDRGWHDSVGGQLPPNLDLRLIGQDHYPASIAALDETFDLIIIDCAANRLHCAVAVGPRLADGGLVVLDNSDWYPNTAAALREQGLIQVDFPDFRPDHWFRCCTSIFIHPAFRPTPRDTRLPLPVLGGKDLTVENKWDRPG